VNLAEQVAAFVADEDGVEALDDTTWRFPFGTGNSEFSVIVAARDVNLLVYATRLDPVSAERVDAVQELIADLNPELTTAWFECNREDGVVSARAGLDTEQIEVGSVLIGNVVGSAVAAMSRFKSAVDAVAAGAITPQQIRELPDPNAAPTLDLDEATADEADAFLREHLPDQS
jgi:hypothetical protein